MISKFKKEKIKVVWYCHKCKYQWKGVRFRKQFRRKRTSRNICPKCGNRMVTPGHGGENWLEIRRKVWERDKL